MGCVFASSTSGYIVYEANPPMYRYWYWGWEFVCVLAGYGVVLELLEKGTGLCLFSLLPHQSHERRKGN